MRLAIIFATAALPALGLAGEAAAMRSTKPGGGGGYVDQKPPRPQVPQHSAPRYVPRPTDTANCKTQNRYACPFWRRWDR